MKRTFSFTHLAQKVLFLSGIFLIGGLTSTQSARAQMDDRPWSFKTQNRASIAALIKQVEDSNSSGNAVVSAGGGAATTLICGGDSADSAATGNASCIILNNSDGSIYLGQTALGDQTADSETTETTNVEETINIDEVLTTINGDASIDTLVE